MSLASDSSNCGFVPSRLYMSWSVSSRLFSIEQTVVPSGLCSVVCVCVLCGVLCEFVLANWIGV